MALRGTKYTLSELKSDISASMRDAGDTRWTESQKELAIKRAIREASPNWWEERIDDKYTYDKSTSRYVLPPASSRVEEVRFKENSMRKVVSPIAWHVEGDELVFEEDFETYDTKTLYIHYAYYQKDLLDITNSDGEVAANKTTFTSTSATFQTDGVKEGSPIIIDGDDRYVVESVNTETELTLWSEATVATSLTYYVAYYTDLPYEYLINKALSELYMIALRNRPGVEVEQYIRLSDYHRQLAALGLAKNRRLEQIEEFSISDIETRASRLALNRDTTGGEGTEELS